MLREQWFCGGLEDKNVKRSADDGGLASETAEGTKDSLRTICVLFCINIWWLWSAGTDD